MIEHLVAPFHYAFMQRAFLTAILVGVLCATMGTYVILRKLAFIGDGIAHASFAGIVIAYLRGTNFYLGAGIVAVITTIGVLFTGAFALGIFLMSRQRTYSVDLQSFLFGDILSVGPQDVVMIVALALVVGIVTTLLFRSLLYTSFDPVVAQASGMNANAIEYVLLVLIALTIIISLQAVGIILVAALLVTPAAAAYQLTDRFAPMMALSALFGALCAVGGLYLSYYLASASGATIVLVATVLFFAAVGGKQVRLAIARRT
jgi:ABC-type Mn2+/Zn2+ transport system permease subunit